MNLHPSIFAILLGLLPLAQLFSAPTMNLNRPYHDSLSYAEKDLSPVSFFSPQNRDFLFDGGEVIEIGLLSQKRAVSAEWKLLQNMGREVLSSGLANPEPDGGFSIAIPTKELKPGFYDVNVEVDFGQKKETFSTTFGYQADKITFAYSPPEDFEDFWAGVREEVLAVPLRAEAGPWQVFDEKEMEGYLTGHAFLPAKPDPAGVRFDSVEVQTVAFDGLNGSRISAHVAKPPVEGRLPAILILPGAGGWNAIRPFPLEHARHGYLAMDVSIHGTGATSPETGEARRDHDSFQMMANAIQSLRYLRSRDDVDPEQIAVVGMSQGGRLAFVLGGLDENIRAVIPSITHYADLEYSSRLEGKPREKANAADAYYDVLAFASNTGAPIYMSAGLTDRVSPAARVYHAWLVAPSKDKTFVPMAGIEHFITFEFDRRAWRWLEEILPPATP